MSLFVDHPKHMHRCLCLCLSTSWLGNVMHLLSFFNSFMQKCGSTTSTSLVVTSTWVPSPRSATCSRIRSFQHLVIRVCGDSEHWRSRIVSALGSSSCPSAHMNGVWIHMAATSLTMQHLALDFGINLLTSLCSSIFAIPIFVDPAVSCAVSMHNKEDLSANMTKNVCRDDKNAHDRAFLHQGKNFWPSATRCSLSPNERRCWSNGAKTTTRLWTLLWWKSARVGPTHRKWSHSASHDTRDLQSRPLQTLATETTCLGATSCLSGSSPRLGASTGEKKLRCRDDDHDVLLSTKIFWVPLFQYFWGCVWAFS